MGQPVVAGPMVVAVVMYFLVTSWNLRERPLPRNGP
jgi:hypothetical protein